MASVVGPSWRRGDDSSRSSNMKALRTQMSKAVRTPAGMERGHRTETGEPRGGGNPSNELLKT